MTYRKKTLVERTIWVVECAGCGWREESAFPRSGERFCGICKEWKPWQKIEWTGPEIGE
jgi:hypothetical protein